MGGTGNTPTVRNGADVLIREENTSENYVKRPN
jgi:hypothetical protein